MVVHGSSWRHHLDHIVRKPLSDEQHTVYPLVDGPTASAVVDLALRVSELALASGSSAADASSFALTVAQAYGVTVDVDVTWTSITICYHRAGVWEPITGFRSVRTRRDNYQILGRLVTFVDRVAHQNIKLADARDEFNELRSTTRPYRPWLMALANGVLGCNIALLLGGGWMEGLLSGFAMIVLYLVRHALSKTGIATFYQQIAGAAVPTIIAILAMVYKNNFTWLADVSPALVVAAGMVSLLAGLGIVTAARDAIEGNLLTSAARTFDALLSTGGIVVGVVGSLAIGIALGVPGTIEPLGAFAGAAWWQAVTAGISSIAFAVTCHMALRSLLSCGLLGLVGYGVFLLVDPVVNHYPTAATAGAIVVGVAAAVIAQPGRASALALVTTAVVSLMPGMMLYRGLYYLLDSSNDASSVLAPMLLRDALITGVGLAAGSMFGVQVVRPFRRIRFGWLTKVISD